MELYEQPGCIMVSTLQQSLHTSPPQRGAATGYLRFALGYWTAPDALGAWLLAAGSIALLLFNLAVNLGLNSWQRWFFDMLERKEAGGLALALSTFTALVLLGAASAVAMVYCRMTLQLGWRRWVTHAIIAQWIRRSSEKIFHIDGENHGSPEYRIVEDVRLAVEPLVELAIGLANAVLLGVTFAGILLTVGGALTIHVSGMEIIIPSYMAIGALLYALLTSTLMFAIGYPLIRRVAQKNEAEGQFLFALTNAIEGTAAPRTARHSQDPFDQPAAAFDGVVRRWRLVIREYCRVTWLTNSNSFFAPVLPLLLAAPKYLSGELSLGAVMQLAAAFVIVLGALNWITDNYVRIAEWSASARRVDELRLALFQPVPVQG